MLYNGNPPCDDPKMCTRPRLLDPNKPAWFLWTLLNEHDREIIAGFGAALPMKLKTSSIINLVDIYGETLETFEKILFIEAEMFPSIVKRAKEPTKTEDNGVRDPDKHQRS